MIIIEKEINITTGKETITEREETTIETQIRLKMQKEKEAIMAEAEAKAVQKAAVLTKLGLTDDEVAALLS